MISAGKGKKRTDCASGNRKTDIAFHTKDGTHICCNATMTAIPKDKDKTKTKTKLRQRQRKRQKQRQRNEASSVASMLHWLQNRRASQIQLSRPGQLKNISAFFLWKSFDARAVTVSQQHLQLLLAWHCTTFVSRQMGTNENDDGKLHWNKAEQMQNTNKQTNKQAFSQQHWQLLLAWNCIENSLFAIVASAALHAHPLSETFHGRFILIVQILWV